MVLQTIPAVLMLPFTGVIIDREDRRHLLMWLDAIRGVIILAIALLIFGPSKLADLGKGLGEGIKNFKSAVKEGEEGSEKKS